MIAQVVTTGRVIATGPRWNRTVLASGEACHHAVRPRRAQRQRARREKAEKGGEQREGAEPRGKAEKGDRAGDAGRGSGPPATRRPPPAA